MSQNEEIMVRNHSAHRMPPYNLQVLPPRRRKGRAVQAERLLFCLFIVLSRRKLSLCPGKLTEDKCRGKDETSAATVSLLASTANHQYWVAAAVLIRVWSGQQPKTFHTFHLRNLAGWQAQQDKLTFTPLGEMGSENVNPIPAAAETEPHDRALASIWNIKVPDWQIN